MLSRETLAEFFDIQLSRDPVWLTPSLAFLGQIERVCDFERTPPLGEVTTAEGQAPDTLPDDTGLVWRGSKGLVLLSGCAHSGVCNMAKTAQTICAEQHFTDILGGLHLQRAPSARLAATGEFLKTLGLTEIHACHCTDLEAKIALAAFVPVREVAVGMRYEYS